MIWDSQAARGMAVSTLTPEFGPPSYQHTLPPDGTPIGNLARFATGRPPSRAALCQPLRSTIQTDTGKEIRWLNDIRRTPALHEPGISPHLRRRTRGVGPAPGRVDLMGSHTDYNMGYVMTMTIDRDTWLAARPGPIAACAPLARYGRLRRIHLDRRPRPRRAMDRLRTRDGAVPGGGRPPADRLRRADPQHRTVRQRPQLVGRPRDGCGDRVPGGRRLPSTRCKWR